MNCILTVKGKTILKEFMVAVAAEGQGLLCVLGDNVRTNRRRSEEVKVSIIYGRTLSYVEPPPEEMGMSWEELVSLSLEVFTGKVCNRQGSQSTLYA